MLSSCASHTVRAWAMSSFTVGSLSGSLTASSSPCARSSPVSLVSTSKRLVRVRLEVQVHALGLRQRPPSQVADDPLLEPPRPQDIGQRLPGRPPPVLREVARLLRESAQERALDHLTRRRVHVRVEPAHAVVPWAHRRPQQLLPRLQRVRRRRRQVAPRWGPRHQQVVDEDGRRAEAQDALVPRD
eukprot:1047904-Prorocentrum_minimum.AAC.1